MERTGYVPRDTDDGHVDVSFIMAARNALPFLEEAVHSGLRQAGVETEIVVVDDGSVDGTGAALARLAAADRRLRVLAVDQARSDMPRGPSWARNLAMDAARGRWLAILDADDLIVPGRTRALLDLAAASGADVIADNPIPFSGAFDPAGAAMLERGSEPYLFDVDVAQYLERNRMLKPGVKLGYLKPMFRRDFIRAQGLRYDENVRIGEDFLFCLDSLAAGARFLVSSFAGYGYRRGPTSLSYRLRSPDIQCLDAAFAARLEHGRLAELHAGRPEIRDACGGYRKGLSTALTIAGVVQAAESGRWRQGLGWALRQPDAWGFLTRSLLSASDKRLRKARLAPWSAFVRQA